MDSYRCVETACRERLLVSNGDFTGIELLLEADLRISGSIPCSCNFWLIFLRSHSTFPELLPLGFLPKSSKYLSLSWATDSSASAVFGFANKTFSFVDAFFKLALATSADLPPGGIAAAAAAAAAETETNYQSNFEVMNIRLSSLQLFRWRIQLNI